MKKLMITVAIVSFGLFNNSCTDDRPSCIDDRIDEFTSQNAQQSFTFIYEFEQDGNQYYIFDNGIAFDAIAEVLDENCQLICTYGGFRINNPDPCDQFQEGINNATQIWPE